MTKRFGALLCALACASTGALLATGCGGGGGGSGGGFLGVSASTLSKSSTAVIQTTTTTGATNATVPADGTSTAKVTVTLLDDNKNPVKNVAVVLAGSGTGNIITVSGLSDAKGVVTGTIASNVVQTETITATALTASGSVPITKPGTMTVTFTQLVASGSSGSRIATSATSVSTDAGNSATITVTLVDEQSGAPVANQAVTLSASGAGVTLGATSLTTGSGGTATTTVSSTLAQSGVVVTATVAPANGSAFTLATPGISFTAGAATHMEFINMPSAVAGNPFELEVDFEDAQGNLVPSVTQEVALGLPSNAFLSGGSPVGPIQVFGPFVPGQGRTTSWGTGTSGNNLYHTIQVAQGGRALFPGLVLTIAGNYTVGAVANGYSNATGSLDVAGNVATQLGFVSGTLTNSADPSVGQVATLVEGSAFRPVVVVSALDAFGNPTSNIPGGIAAHKVTLRETSNTITLTGGSATAQNPSSGSTWTFTGVGVPVSTAAATLYTLTAKDAPQGNNAPAALFSAQSASFEIVSATSACGVVVKTPPATLTAGTASSTQSSIDFQTNLAQSALSQGKASVNIQVYDSALNLLPSSDYSPANLTASSAGTSTLPFNLRIDRAGTGFIVVATGYDIDSNGNHVPLFGCVASSTITVNPATAVNSIQFTQNVGRGYAQGQVPPNHSSGGKLPTLQVTAYDGYGSANGALGNVVTSFGNASTDVITLRLTQGTKPAGGATTGSLSFSSQSGSSVKVRASNGVATFADVSLGGAGAIGYGYQLTATDPSAKSASISPINVLAAGQPASVSFINHPINPQTNIDGGPVVPDSGLNFLVGVKDIAGASLTTAGLFIGMAPLSQGIGSPAGMGPTLNKGTLKSTTVGGLPTDATGVATFGYYATPANALYVYENDDSVGASLYVWNTVPFADSLGNAYDLNHDATAPFDIWPGDAERNNFVTFQDFVSGVVVPQVPSGSGITQANQLGQVGPAGKGMSYGPYVLLFEDAENDTPSFYNGASVVAQLRPAAAQVYVTMQIPAASSSLQLGDLVSPFWFQAYGRIVALSGNSVTIRVTQGAFPEGGQPGGNFPFGIFVSSADQSVNRGAFFYGNCVAANAEAGTVTMTTSGVSAGDVLVDTTGARISVVDVRTGQLSAQTVAGESVSLTLGSTSGFAVGDLLVEQSTGSLGIINTVSSGTGVVTVGMLPGALVTPVTVANSALFNVGDSVTAGNGAAGIVAAIPSGTTLTIAATSLQVWLGSSTITNVSTGSPAVSYTGAFSQVATFWSAGPTGNVRDTASTANVAFSAYTGGTKTCVSGFPGASGILYSLATGAKVAYTAASFQPVTGLYGHLIGTTTVHVVNGVAVFDNLAVTGQSFPTGFSVPYQVAFGLVDQTQQPVADFYGPFSNMVLIKQ